MFLTVCSATAERFTKSIRFVLIFYFFVCWEKKRGRKLVRKAYNTAEIKVQEE